jgi:hypothetical protein
MNVNNVVRLAVGMACGTYLASAGSISYTCDATVASIDGSGVCGFLNSTVAGIYSSTFSNANASIYITTASSGLGESVQVTQYVTYGQYYTALSAESNDITALASLPSVELPVFSSSSQYVGVTAALTDALGIPGAATGYGAIYGVSPGAGGTNPGLTACVLGTANCYNGVIEVVTPAGLSAETGGTQGLWFRDVAGTASGAQPANDYDYFSTVEHETDELLGTASCADVNAGPTIVNTCTAGGQIGASPSAVDLFRYSAPGTLVFDSTTAAYFSPNGGVTDTDGNTYNSTVAGADYADFSQNCVFVQDAFGCPGQSVDITNDFLGAPGPEVQILNAVGYDVIPEPGTVTLLALGLAAFAVVRRTRASAQAMSRRPVHRVLPSCARAFALKNDLD